MIYCLLYSQILFHVFSVFSIFFLFLSRLSLFFKCFTAPPNPVEPLRPLPGTPTPHPAHRCQQLESDFLKQGRGRDQYDPVYVPTEKRHVIDSDPEGGTLRLPPCRHGTVLTTLVKACAGQEKSPTYRGNLHSLTDLTSVGGT